MKKPSGAKKTAKKTAKKNAKKTLKKTVLGCCTLTGSGPDQQIERITRADCRQRAIDAGMNFHWVAGDCAEPG